MKFNLSGSSVAMLSMAISLAVTATTAQAQSSEQNIYVGAGLSINRSSHLGSKIDGALGAQGISSSSSATASSTNPNLRLGYQINPNWAVEASYDRIGNLAAQSTVSQPSADTANGNWNARGYGLHVLGIVPVDQKFSVYGRIGVEQWNTHLSLASTTGGTTQLSNTSSNTSLAVGAGTSYKLSKTLDLTGEFTRYTAVGAMTTTGQEPVNQFSAGLRLHFM
jgi:opacity protein-like surface antigen